MYPNQQPPQGYPQQGGPYPPAGQPQQPWGQPAYGQAPGYPAPGYPPGQQGKMNGFAVASFIFGLIGGCGLSLIFGLVALGQIRSRGQRGRGLAIAGMLLTLVWVAVGAIGVFYIRAHEPSRDASGSVTTGGTQQVTDLHVGDCVDGIQEAVRVTDVKVLPCTEPHDGEVISTFNLPGTWVSSTDAETQADTKCTDNIEKALANSPALDDLRIFYYYPANKKQFDLDSSVSCLVKNDNGSKLTAKVPR
ncbi:DUF4190 domain-containing protein [Nocardia stercoris]|uniref:Septum formation-related domain-containing protein n=1 Tax=Nocardia stercoris TaxID=2483361 RepID=A0A3M2L7K8_9NOCA|nr:DUF4190 domain-containing protein [Nocardia stercoris]RMI31895.1 hypothetical protein EBN03_17140 [Nocardia stercoris]